MFTTYSVVNGDTFEIIARKKYGDETEANRIAQANPGVSEPLIVGIKLVIPALSDAPQNLQQQSTPNNQNEVAILIDDIRFRFWQSPRIKRSIDSMDTIEFTAPFDVDAPKFREMFRPFSYKSIVVTVGGIPLFTGTMINIDPVVKNDGKIIAVNGYSIPGVLDDCTPPASEFQLERMQFDNQGLQNIVKTLTIPFGIGVDFQADQGAIFERVAIKPKKKILTFLVGLAKQRNLIISSTPLGKLLIQQSVDIGNPVARLQQESSPVLSITPLFNPQEYYSHITGIEAEFLGSPGATFTVKNPHLQGVIRPFAFDVPDTVDADLKAATEAKAGRMFGNTALYSVQVDTWRDPLGNLWKPNTTIMLLAPDAMVYNEFEFIIRSVIYERGESSEIATLELALPGSFKGKISEALPWDG